MQAQLANQRRAQDTTPHPRANVQLAARAGSFSSFGGGSSAGLQLAARAGSLSSLGASSSASLSAQGSGYAGSCSPVGKARSSQALLDGLDTHLPPISPADAAAALGQQMQRVRLAS